MEELENSPLDTQPIAQEEKKSTLSIKPVLKKAGWGISILLLLYVIGSVVMIYISPDNNIRQIYLIPKDAAFIIQTSEPVKDWKKFSNSDTWKTLKQAKAFDEVAEQVAEMDSILHSNKALLFLVGKRDMLISLHKTRPRDWDALIVIDLQKASKIDVLKDQMENLMKLSGNAVTNRKYKDFTILEMKDTDTNEILHVAFIDNHVVASYTPQLVEASINERENPYIGLHPAFMEAETQVGDKGLFRLFINYNQLTSFMSVYMDEKNEYMEMFNQSMDFAGLYFNTDKEKNGSKRIYLPERKCRPLYRSPA